MFPVLREVLGNLFRKPFTVRYPKVKVEAPESYRGKIRFYREKCSHCRLCPRVCPTGACVFNEKTTWPEFDLGLCMFCGECEENCPTKAIELTSEFEMAGTKPPIIK